MKKVPKLKSIRGSHSLVRGREIHYKSICPAHFDIINFATKKKSKFCIKRVDSS